MTRSKENPPHPPGETVADLRAALRRNHPELSEAQLDAILGGEPKRRRPDGQARKNWYVAKGKDGGAGAVHRRGRGRS